VAINTRNTRVTRARHSLEEDQGDGSGADVETGMGDHTRFGWGSGGVGLGEEEEQSAVVIDSSSSAHPSVSASAFSSVSSTSGAAAAAGRVGNRPTQSTPPNTPLASSGNSWSAAAGGGLGGGFEGGFDGGAQELESLDDEDRALLASEPGIWWDANHHSPLHIFDDEDDAGFNEWRAREDMAAATMGADRNANGPHSTTAATTDETSGGDEINDNEWLNDQLNARSPNPETAAARHSASSPATTASSSHNTAANTGTGGLTGRDALDEDMSRRAAARAHVRSYARAARARAEERERGGQGEQHSPAAEEEEGAEGTPPAGRAWASSRPPPAMMAAAAWDDGYMSAQAEAYDEAMRRMYDDMSAWYWMPASVSALGSASYPHPAAAASSAAAAASSATTSTNPSLSATFWPSRNGNFNYYDPYGYGYGYGNGYYYPPMNGGGGGGGYGGYGGYGNSYPSPYSYPQVFYANANYRDWSMPRRMAGSGSGSGSGIGSRQPYYRQPYPYPSYRQPAAVNSAYPAYVALIPVSAATTTATTATIGSASLIRPVASATSATQPLMGASEASLASSSNSAAAYYMASSAAGAGDRVPGWAAGTGTASAAGTSDGPWPSPTAAAAANSQDPSTSTSTPTTTPSMPVAARVESSVGSEGPCPAISSWDVEIKQDANMHTIRFTTPKELNWVEVHWTKGAGEDGVWEHNYRMQRVRVENGVKWISSMFDSTESLRSGDMVSCFFTYSTSGIDCDTAVVAVRVP